MSIRIHAQSIYTDVVPGFEGNRGDGYRRINEGVSRVYQRVLRPDTVVEPCFVTRSTYLTSHAYLELLNNVELLRGIIDGEARGSDVAFIRCGNDPALREAREAVRIPVVGMSEAAMHFACRLGSKFAMIGVDDKSVPLVERNIRLYGLEGRAISRKPVRIPTVPGFEAVVRNGPMWFDSPDYVREHVIPAFDETARGCIDDGAEVIVTACALFGALTLADYNKVSGTEVPVVDSLAVGIKTAEMAGDLYRTLGVATSKHLTYQSQLPPETRDALMAPFFPADKGS